MKEQDEKTLVGYIKELKTIKKNRILRQDLLKMIFWEYDNYNTHMFEDRDTKIFKIIPEKKVYPNSFFGSSLGFNKNTIETKYAEVLAKFKLSKKPQVASPRNCLDFEKMKLLLVKLFELKDNR